MKYLTTNRYKQTDRFTCKICYSKFQNFWPLSVFWNKPCWFFALQWCASIIHLLSLFTF